MKKPLAQWTADFFTGLAIVLPAVVSIGIVIWLFGTVANFTDTLLFFLQALARTNGECPCGSEFGGAGLAILRSAWCLLAHYSAKSIQLADLLMRVPTQQDLAL